MPVNYFDSARDHELIKAGTHFWCGICLVARPNSEASPRDGRCLACYETLHQEPTPPTIPIKETWDIIASDLSDVKPQAQDTAGKRGPRHHALPIPLIKQLAAEKKSSREIANEVKLQTKTKVSYRTVQRILSGQREEYCHAR